VCATNPDTGRGICGAVRSPLKVKFDGQKIPNECVFPPVPFRVPGCQGVPERASGTSRLIWLLIEMTGFRDGDTIKGTF